MMSDTQIPVASLRVIESVKWQQGMPHDQETDFAGRSPISVIIPAFNEEVGIGPQIESVRQALLECQLQHEIIVVDDGSQDQTASKALETGVRVLQHPQNRGYGASLKTGILAAENDVVAIIDADGTYPSEEIPKMLDLLQGADMVVGARTGSHVEIPWIRRPGKWLLRWLAARIADQQIPDLNSGLRIFRRSCIQQYFPILSDRFSFTTTSTLSLLADEYRVVYHPINYYARVGKSKITPKHFIDFLILILRMAMLFQPLKVFVPLALFFGTVGGLKLVWDAISLFLRHARFDLTLLYQPTISTSAILTLMVGFQLLLMGMMADGVIRRIGQNNRHQAPSHGDWGIELTSNKNQNSITSTDV